MCLPRPFLPGFRIARRLWGRNIALSHVGIEGGLLGRLHFSCIGKRVQKFRRMFSFAKGSAFVVELIRLLVLDFGSSLRFEVGRIIQMGRRLIALLAYSELTAVGFARLFFDLRFRHVLGQRGGLILA